MKLHDLFFFVGAVLISVGVGLHDLGYGLAAGGLILLLVGLLSARAG